MQRPGTIDRLHKTADFINADRRVLICRVARKIQNERLLVINPTNWARMLMNGPS